MKLILAACLLAASAVLAHPASAETDAGKQVYERANCVGCHKWSGRGGGGYGGAALSLRATELSRDDIVQIVRCGRPGTGMPHFTADPYKDGACYGLRDDDVKDMRPPNANVVLRPAEIESVADYVTAAIKGRGEPTLADCTAFFGTESRACDIYQPHAAGGDAPRHPMPTPSTTAR